MPTLTTLRLIDACDKLLPARCFLRSLDKRESYASTVRFYDLDWCGEHSLSSWVLFKDVFAPHMLGHVVATMFINGGRRAFGIMVNDGKFSAHLVEARLRTPSVLRW